MNRELDRRRNNRPVILGKRRGVGMSFGFASYLKQSALMGLLAGMFLTGALSRARASEADEATATTGAAVEFFERKVRPILVERCQKCHGASKQKGGLRLDAAAAVLKGGATGPAVVAGKPEESLLVGAINYGELYQMPPKSKLPAEEIATLTRWVKEGAVWGFESSSKKNDTAATGKSGPLIALGSPGEYERRARHWCFQPIRKNSPPAVSEAWCGWPRNPVDRFLLAAMEKRGLTPAPEADRRTLIRRLTFDLTGLPPTAGEIASFLSDRSPSAYEDRVDRLLANPHYGERWGRHWLDLARFAETAGHEFDYDIPNAFRYRDYVIRALNVDLPYDKFLTEQVAGDLLASPRRHPIAEFNESLLGTGFFLLGEGTHSPVDAREEEVRRIDNQIDVFAKTFLGLTVACARCHDHKFDPITSKDYYALAGFLKSSRHQQAFIDAVDRIEVKSARLRQLKKALGDWLAQSAPALPDAMRSQVRRLIAGTDNRRVVRLAARDASDAAHAAGDRATSSFESFNLDSFRDWYVAGDAFGDAPARAGDFRLELSSSGSRLIPVRPGQASSGLVSDRLQGVLRSRTFTLEHRFIHYLVSGHGGRINVVVDGFEKIRDPIYGGLTLSVDVGDEPRWLTQDVGMWLGRRAYLEIADGAIARFDGATTSLADGHGSLSVDEIVMSDRRESRARPHEARGSIDLEVARRALLVKNPLLAHELDSILDEYRGVEATIPDPTLALAIADGTGENERVLIRGNPLSPGEIVPRRLLEILGGSGQATPETGSGRLDLARRMIDPRSNPLVPRVIVNRLWKHHFGEGLVKSTDDFGAMGQKPSHPDLLDWLAAEFVDRGWSIKALHRLLVTSSAYRMSSALDENAERLDPTNVWLHRMNVRRLEAEAIRDALLAVSGRLDTAMYGPSVPPYLSSFMEGRGRPKRSGPLDGDGRRSVYLNVRRNFLNPMLQAFDAPVPFSCMGRRNVSNVPAQALTLLNDPLVINLASLWAEQILNCSTTSDQERIDGMFQIPLGRTPTERERRDCLAFLHTRQAVDPAADARAAWADLCHVLINVKEFIFIN
jgi:mono/diheme cytochrome c family protein